MPTNEYRIRPMTRHEVDTAVEWAVEEGWNPGLNDAECYFAADPGGFLVGTLDDRPIATISAINYGGAFGFVGFYIVAPEFRGRGYGIRIWRAALDRLQGLNVGLDGVVAQQENYKRSGFKLAYRNIRYEGRGGGDAPADDTAVELSTLPFATVQAYDQPFFPADRAPFLKAWLDQPGSHALGLVENGELTGYGVIRPCHAGWKIGPLYADGPQAAERLFRALSARATPGDAVYLDVPEVNREAVALAEGHGMSVSFETARMYTGDAPALPLERLFGVTSFEIG